MFPIRVIVANQQDHTPLSNTDPLVWCFVHTPTLTRTVGIYEDESSRPPNARNQGLRTNGPTIDTIPGGRDSIRALVVRAAAQIQIQIQCLAQHEQWRLDNRMPNAGIAVKQKYYRVLSSGRTKCRSVIFRPNA